MANRSNFPNAIDTFTELYDLPPSQVTNARRLQTLKQQATLSSAEQEELNGLVAQLGDYMITPEIWNKFADSLTNMEVFLTEEIMGYIAQKQAEWDAYVNDFNYVGVHSTSKTYKFQNMAKYNGETYLALRDVPTGIAISNESYWVKIASKGDKGDVGLNVYYKGNYSETETYAVGDAIDYDGGLYYATETTVAGESPANSDKWFIMDKTIMSAEQPVAPQKGLIWIEEL